MRNFRRALDEFHAADAQWKVLKTTDAYTQLLRAHANLSKSYAELSVKIVAVMCVTALIVMGAAILSWTSR